MRINQINPAEWYDIPNYDGKYQINYYGKICRALKDGRFKELHPYVKSSNRRQAVKLNSRERDVMSLMRDTFIGKVPKNYILYHKNGILTDNVLSNIGITTRSELGKKTGSWNGCEIPIVKINSEGEIVEFYKSVREAGRKNYLSYQAILDRLSGQSKSLYAPDGYVYVRDRESDVNRAIRRIELENKKDCCVVFTKAPNVAFDF